MKRHQAVVAAWIWAAVLISAARAERAEIVIRAEDLAPAELRGDKPTPGKWWLKRDAQDWAAPNGMILMTGEPSDLPNKSGEWVVTAAHRFTPYRVPPLVVDPQATGCYRIYVGLYYEAMDPTVRPKLLAKLSHEPYPEYLQPLDDTKGRTVEVYWKAAHR
jgi:hypothetical protein